jgi:phosphate transport system substrate-binding protein
MLMRRSAAASIIAASISIISSITLHSAQGAEVAGAGSSFVAPIITEWAADYAKVTGTTVSYDSVGSGAGIERIRQGIVDFGATDKPLSPQELSEAGLCQFPVVVGGVVPVVNLSGISAGQLKFSGALLADIYMGKVTSWDAAEIKALNPDIALPSLAISVVHRSDGSGTTYNWVDFLSKASAAWKEKVGVGLSVSWPTGMGSNGNAGVAESVTHTQGAIGYVEYSYAVQNHLAFGQVQNAHGLFVSPSADTFQSAAMTVDWRRHQDFSVLMTNAGGPDAYPITATTFILMYKSPKDPNRATLALAFFKWALESGDQQASKLNYAPLPAVLVKLVEAYWTSQIRGQGVVTGN